MAFDPDAYLAAKTAPPVADPPATGFDPDAYLKSKASPESGFNPDSYLGTKYDQLAKDESFDPVAHYTQNPEDLATAREVFKRRAAEPMDWVGDTVRGAGALATAVPSAAISMAKGAAGFVGNAAQRALGIGTEAERQRAALENMASLQLGTQKFADLAIGTGRNIGRVYGKWDRDLTDEEINHRIQYDAARQQIENELQHGELAGDAAQNYANPKDLAAQGVPVRPENVENASYFGDPTTYVIPGLAEAAGPMIGKAVTAPVLGTAGKAISGVGSVANKIFKGDRGLVGIGLGYAMHGISPLAPGATFAAEMAAKHVAPGIGRILQEAGAEAGGALPPGIQSAATKALKAGAQGAVTGAAISAPFAAAAQSPEEVGSALGGGLGIGGALGATGGVIHGRAIDVAGKFNQLAQEGAG